MTTPGGKDTDAHSEPPPGEPSVDDALAQAGADSAGLDVPSALPDHKSAGPSQPADANPEKAQVAAKSAADAAASGAAANTGGAQQSEKSAAQDARARVGGEGAPAGRPGVNDAKEPADSVTADDLTAEQKLEHPEVTGRLATDPAASVEKAAEAAAPAPEGANPANAAGEAKPAAPKTAKPAGDRPARPAREAEPKEAPRLAPPAGSINELLAEAVPGVQMKAYVVPGLTNDSVAVEVNRDDLPAVMTAARDDARLNLTYLRNLSGIDWQDEGLEVVYHLLSMDKLHQLTVKTRVTYEDPVVPSIAELYPAADWHERETRDMFGIVFEGHPNLVPLLLPEDMTDHFPLRKDNPLQEIEEWQGENLREGAGEGDE